MHYVAIVDGAEHEVEISETEPFRYQLTIDKRPPLEVDARPLRDDTLSLICRNEAHSVESETANEGGENLLVRGRIVHAEVLDLRRNRLRHATKTGPASDGPVEISAPMPGKIIAVLVNEGQKVAEGEGLLVIEAMKMENELKAPRSGVVRKLTAQAGSAVDGGTSLCVIEPAAAA